MFTVLMVCLGNICRSPMAEVLLRRRLLELLGDRAAEVRVHSAGTGTWPMGDPMNPPALQEILARGGEPGEFRARNLQPELVAESDLILTATRDQVEVVLVKDASAKDRTFVMGEFGRLLPGACEGLVAASPAERGRAMVASAARLRAGAPSRETDEIPDPWGGSQAYFGEIADLMEETLTPLALAIAGASEPRSR